MPQQARDERQPVDRPANEQPVDGGTSFGPEDPWAPLVEVAFQPPGTGETVYERYLETQALYQLQLPRPPLGHHDEFLFRTVHQACELWMNLMSFELTTVLALLAHERAPEALRLLRRVVLAGRLVVRQLELMETMSAWDYHGIRRKLSGGSGLQSPSFPNLLRLGHQVWDHFEALRQHAGLALPEVYTRRYDHPLLHELAEALVDLDETVQSFRYHHYKLAQRMIGTSVIGTGGVQVEALERSIHRSLFPELWRVRDALTARASSTYE
ncbi:MAG: hypothetical protein HY690_13765 [Chloroflexi bacterium]|nr:hypothetical protein [Chloroflexota bacterium]